MKKLLFIALTGLVFISCNKDQKAINDLDGRWKASSYIQETFDETNDFLEDGAGYEMTFTKCKQPKDISFADEDIFEEVLEKGCDLEIAVTDSTGSNYRIAGKYVLSEDGTFITFATTEFVTSVQEAEDEDFDDKLSFFSITELTTSQLSLILNEDGVKNTIVLDK